MTDTSVAELRRTPLHASHLAADARMVPFAGWEMPLEYTGISAEHMAVRTRAGLFDVSHMGELEVAGTNALAAVQRISCNDAGRLEVGQAQYTGLLSERGTFLDDMIVYRIGPSHFLIVVNASNTASDYVWIRERIREVGDAVVIDSSSRYALIAVQGPASREVLQPLTGVDLEGLVPFSFAHGEVASARATIARTGYTGEDGFEIFVPPSVAVPVWRALQDSGRAVEVVPVGLGARDTLRLEASLRLHGQDIDDSTTPLEARLAWMVSWTKPEFIGRPRLEAQRAAGVEKALVGFEMVDRGIARPGYPVVRAGTPVGKVTSGTHTPFLRKAIGMAYVPADLAAEGSEFEIDVRGRASRACVVRMPFYRRPKG